MPSHFIWVSRKLILLCVLLAPLIVTPAMAQDGFGKEIMAAPFDEKPFRQVEVPEWLNGLTSYAYMGPEQYAAAAEMGVQGTEIAFGNPQFVYYDSKLLPRDPNVAADMVDQRVATAKQAGLRIIAAIPPCFQAAMYVQHPDWRGIPTDTTEIPSKDMTKNPEGGWMCQIGPWGDYMIEVLAEIMTKYPDVDGFGFDGIHHARACYCQHCRANFLKETGKAMPDMKKGLDDPEVRVYEAWMNRQMERFVERMQARIKGIKPTAVLLTWTTAAGRFGHLRSSPTEMSTRMNLLFDAPAQEFWLDETNRGNTIVPAFANAYIWTVTNHRQAFSEPYLFSHGNPYGTDSFPAHEIRRRVLLALTHGAQASLALGWKKTLYEGQKICFEDIHARAPWLTHKKPEPWAALLMSENTRLYYGRESGKVEERYLASVFGTFRATQEEHLPTAVINDWNVNAADLAGYKVLVMPNAACVSEAQAAAVRTFVQNGGGLIASLETSLFDELGNPRKDYALADVFGLNYRGTPSSEAQTGVELDPNFMHGVDEAYWAKRKGIYHFAPLQHATHPIYQHPKLVEYLNGEQVTFKGAAVAVELSGAESLANLSPDGGKVAVPGMAVAQFGKGRVVFMAAGLDGGYYMYPYPYQRLLLAQAMRWAAGEAPRVRIEAPMCVQSSVLRQTKEGERLVVHLYNNINTTGGAAFPNDDVPLREESVAIHGIKVGFDVVYGIKKFHLEPGGVELKPVMQDDMAVVELPPLEMQYMVVGEL